MGPIGITCILFGAFAVFAVLYGVISDAAFKKKRSEDQLRKLEEARRKKKNWPIR